MDTSWPGVLVLTVGLAGCATSENPKDPLEHFNRAMFGFNDKVDQIALKPVAKAYHNVLPSFVQTGVSNFFGNLGDVWTGVNNLLQGKVHNGATDFLRVGINSTFGVGGLWDIGTAIGLPKRNKDFGLTLGWWGVKSGPYVVLPLFGPSTLRDSVALPVDYLGDPWSYKYPVRQRNEGSLLRIVEQRANALDASQLVEAAALDRYEFVRDAYLQRREDKVRDEEGQKLTPNDTQKPKLQNSSGLNTNFLIPLEFQGISDASNQIMQQGQAEPEHITQEHAALIVPKNQELPGNSAVTATTDVTLPALRLSSTASTE